MVLHSIKTNRTGPSNEISDDPNDATSTYTYTYLETIYTGTSTVTAMRSDI